MDCSHFFETLNYTPRSNSLYEAACLVEYIKMLEESEKIKELPPIQTNYQDLEKLESIIFINKHPKIKTVDELIEYFEIDKKYNQYVEFLENIGLDLEYVSHRTTYMNVMIIDSVVQKYGSITPFSRDYWKPRNTFVNWIALESNILNAYIIDSPYIMKPNALISQAEAIEVFRSLDNDIYKIFDKMSETRSTFWRYQK